MTRCNFCPFGFLDVCPGADINVRAACSEAGQAFEEWREQMRALLAGMDVYTGDLQP